MTSPLPPRRRDTRSIADRVRQDRANLRQLDPGLMDGRFSPTKPPEPFLEDDEEGDDEDGNLDLVRFLNTDRVILATDGGTPIIPLTYIPDDGSEQVFWAGDALARHEWSRTDSALTIPAQSYYKANEEFWVDYAYYGEPSDLAPEPVGPDPTFPYESDWRYLFTTDGAADYSGASVADSGWSVGTGGFWYEHFVTVPSGWPKNTGWPPGNYGWFRRDLGVSATDRTLNFRHSGDISIWLGGVLLHSWPTAVAYEELPWIIPAGSSGVLAVKAAESATPGAYFDAEVVA